MVYLFFVFVIEGLILTVLFRETHDKTIGVFASSALASGFVILIHMLNNFWRNKL